jgi:hypothetical protein
MRRGLTTALVLCAVLLAALPAFAQAPRQDLIWARSTAGAPITLDGVLSEPAWAKAESVVVRYGVDNGLPGSGFKGEGGWLPADPTRATIKFLTDGNILYMAAVVPDSSVGGSVDFNRFDGFLMGLKDHSVADRPAPVIEYFYSWWAPTDTLHASDPGRLPVFNTGKWSSYPSPRTPAEIDAWDAATTVDGVSNSDAGVDKGYTIEMKFNLTPIGYDVTQPAGDVVEWNVDIYDCDWYWPIDFWRFTSSRSWWQDPWGNTSWYDEVRIHARPDVTVNSGALPTIGPELRVPNAVNFPNPVIDGVLNDPVYAYADSVHIKFGDTALRDSYGNPGKYRSGEFQPDVNGGKAVVRDPADATVKYFFKEDTLYLGFDVRDKYVQFHTLYDRWDGFTVSINDYLARAPDSNLAGHRLSFQVGASGQLLAQDWLPYLRDTLHGARAALQLKPGTSVDTTASGVDLGWQAELAVDLTKLNYPHGRGDGRLFLGVDLLDGDSFTIITNSYGTRTWWWREHEAKCCPPWGYLDPNLKLVDVEGSPPLPAGSFVLLGNTPNPFMRGTVVRYVMAEPADVVLEVYDLRGRLTQRRALGLVPAGTQQVALDAVGASGLHFYRLRLTDHASGALKATLTGKMLLLR